MSTESLDLLAIFITSTLPHKGQHLVLRLDENLYDKKKHIKVQCQKKSSNQCETDIRKINDNIPRGAHNVSTRRLTSPTVGCVIHGIFGTITAVKLGTYLCSIK